MIYILYSTRKETEGGALATQRIVTDNRRREQRQRERGRKGEPAVNRQPGFRQGERQLVARTGGGGGEEEENTCREPQTPSSKEFYLPKPRAELGRRQLRSAPGLKAPEECLVAAACCLNITFSSL